MLGSDNSWNLGDKERCKGGTEEELASPGQVNLLHGSDKSFVKCLQAKAKEYHQRMKEGCFTWQQNSWRVEAPPI